MKLTEAEKAEILASREEAARRHKVPAKVYAALEVAEHYRAWEADPGENVSHPTWDRICDALLALETFVRKEKKL